MKFRPPAHCELLLRGLREPHALRHLGPAEWELLIRVARRGRLHGVLPARLAADGALHFVPDRVLTHLESGAAVARYRLQMARLEQHHLARALADVGAPLVLLKGGAYAAQGLAVAEGRPLNDLDIMTPAEHLPRVEAALRRSGWRSPVEDPYDQRYYREWSHEVPPLRGEGRMLEVDLHHTILPPTGRLRADADRLFADAVPLAGSPFSVLSPADQVLHASVHLFQDVDVAERLRDVVDLDGLLRAYGDRPRFWTALVEHAAHHGLQRPLWYALHFARVWLGTPIDAAVPTALSSCAPNAVTQALMHALFGSTLLPFHPDRGPTLRRTAAWQLLRTRAMWLRMPPGLLVRHAGTKFARAVAR